MNNNFAMDVVADQINVVSTAVMGLSVACARCHDHKFDPIPTSDYYDPSDFLRVVSASLVLPLSADTSLPARTCRISHVHRIGSDYMPRSTTPEESSAPAQ